MDFPSVVKTKIALPRKQPGLLHRARLVDFIHENIHRRLILISAAAGYGKTSLLIDYAHDTNLPVCWYSLDQTDRDVRVFLEHLVASIIQRFPALARGQVASLLKSAASNIQTEAILRALVNDIHDNVKDYFVILLDDYQFMDESEEVNSAVTWLLDHLPDSCCLIVSTRTTPHFPLLRLVARQQVAALGNDLLRFTPKEIQQFLNQNYNLHLPDEEAEKLAQESEGWITGILLSTHTLWRGLIETVMHWKEGEPKLFAYLAEEVFDQQEEELQDFLKGSSILEVMEADLCDQLLGADNSREMLGVLEDRNLFITKLEGEPYTYRYHQLFQEFVRTRFQPGEKARVEALHLKAGHLKAGHLLKERRDGLAATRHYVKAEDYEEAARTIEGLANSLFSAGKFRTLADLIDSLPDQATNNHPRLLVTRGMIRAERGDFSAAERLFQRARRRFQVTGDMAGVARVLIREAMLFHLCGEYEKAIRRCRQVLSLAAKTEIDRSSVAAAHRILGMCYGSVVNLGRSQEELNLALEIYQEIGDRHEIANVNQGLGTTLRRLGRAEEAEPHYRTAVAMWDKLGNLARGAEVLNNIGVGHYYRGEYGEALEVLQDALSRARKAGHSRVEASILASIGDIYRDLGQVDRAVSFYDQGQELAQLAGDGFLLIYLLTARGDSWRLRGDEKKAAAALDKAMAMAEDQNSKYDLGLARLSKGILCYQQGDPPQAVRHLESACENLAKVGAKRELARASLHLAYTFYLTGEIPPAEKWMRASLDLSRETTYDQYLVVDGRSMQPLLRHALERGLGADMLSAVLERIDQFPPAIPEEVAPSKEPEVTPLLEIHALGRSRIKVGDHDVPRPEWGGPLVKELFFHLAEKGQARKEEIALVFWPDKSPAKMNSVFHATMHRLRRVVRLGSVVFDRDSETYLFDRSTNYRYDVEEFERLLARTRGARPDEAEELYRQALSLYEGDYMEDSYSDWCVTRREQLGRRYLNALSELASLLMTKGAFQESVDLFYKVLEKDPYRERAMRGIMRCLALSGEPAIAIQRYLSYAEFLELELGTSPAKETMDLCDQIRKEALRTREPTE